MPPTTNISPEAPAKKSATKQPKDPEWKKQILRDNETKPSETRCTQGAGETPVTPKPSKPKKPKEPKERKPADTSPKKNAQRAKGSISLNKTLEHPAEVEQKRCPPVPSAEKIPRSEVRKTPVEEPKTPTSQQKRKKKRDGPPGRNEAKGEKKQPVATTRPPKTPPQNPPLSKPTSSTSVEEAIEVALDNKEPPPVVVDQEVKSDALGGVSSGINSCSFFERLQQGVKAYFSSRSSFNPEERNKKEGGIRTRGRVGKGVKEEVKKRRPRIIIKNNNPESVLRTDRLRVSGGHSNRNFLTNKPKILRDFRKMKRKKLYHPKKCYVRIQIPRKGYFYRSTVGLQSPQLASSNPLQPVRKTKVDPKSQISRLAPTRSKTASLPVKKILKKEAPDPEPSQQDTSKAKPEVFDHWVNEYLASNWPGKDTSFEDALVEFETARTVEEGLISAISDNYCSNFRQKWDSIVDCIGSTFGKEQFVYNFEISGGVSPFAVLRDTQESDTAVEMPPSKPTDPTAFLMDEVDLHLELQNYLKGIEKYQRGKHTLLYNYNDNYIPLKIYSSSQDLQSRAEEYFDVVEYKSATSFDTATSDCPQLGEVTDEMLLDVMEKPDPATETLKDMTDDEGTLNSGEEMQKPIIEHTGNLDSAKQATEDTQNLNSKKQTLPTVTETTENLNLGENTNKEATINPTSGEEPLKQATEETEMPKLGNKPLENVTEDARKLNSENKVTEDTQKLNMCQKQDAEATEKLKQDTQQSKPVAGDTEVPKLGSKPESEATQKPTSGSPMLQTVAEALALNLEKKLDREAAEKLNSDKELLKQVAGDTGKLTDVKQYLKNPTQDTEKPKEQLKQATEDTQKLNTCQKLDAEATEKPNSGKELLKQATGDTEKLRLRQHLLNNVEKATEKLNSAQQLFKHIVEDTRKVTSGQQVLQQNSGETGKPNAGKQELNNATHDTEKTNLGNYVTEEAEMLKLGSNNVTEDTQKLSSGKKLHKNTTENTEKPNYVTEELEMLKMGKNLPKNVMEDTQKLNSEKLFKNTSENTENSGKKPHVENTEKLIATAHSETDSAEHLLKNSLKRTAGKTSFRVFRLDDKSTWDVLSPKTERPNEDYEKIQPLYPAEKGKKIRNLLILTNPQAVRSPQHQPHVPKWSPTLPELIDIYNSVLKQNTKLRRNSTMTRRISSHLFSFLKEKLQEKLYKFDLLSKMKYTPPNFVKTCKSKYDMVTIEEYVAMFQEILHSNLSINQITRLNNTISGLQDYSEKNYNYMKELTGDARNLSLRCIPEEPGTTEPANKTPKTPGTIKKVRKVVPKSKKTSKPKPKAQTTAGEVRKRQKKPKTKSKAKSKGKSKPKSPKEKIKKTMLSSPAELESILKFYLGEKGPSKEQQTKDKKILVSVKLNGNQVLVDGFSYFDNEKALSGEKPEENGTSELIIENITRDQVLRDVMWKNNKSSRLRIQLQKPKVAAPKIKKRKRTKVEKSKKTAPKVVKPQQQDEQQSHFEYNQMQLREQHPIEAIAELSESKVSQNVEQLEEGQKKTEPTPVEKPLLQDVSVKEVKQVSKTERKRKLKKCPKDQIFGWTDEELGMAGSKFTPKLKQKPTPQKKKAVMVRSMVELKKRPPARAKCSKTQAYRPQKTYLCYSSKQNIQGKVSKKQQWENIGCGASSKTKPTKTTEKRKTTKQAWLKEGKSQLTTYKPTEKLFSCTTAEWQKQTWAEMPPDRNRCELEFLFSDDGNSTLTNIDSASEETQTTASVISLQKDDSFCSVASKEKESIALLQPSNWNDCVSFLTEMIHSDSFLVNVHHHTTSQTRLKSLLRRNSEVKFYPGRLQDGVTPEENPLVTFVLTPSQHQMANLPDNQVTVVKKGEAGAVAAENEDDSDSEGTQEHSLKSIEKFIDYLSKCRKIAQKATPAKQPTGENKSKPAAQKAKPTPGKPSPDSKNRTNRKVPTRKPLHECPRRKLTEKITKKPVKPKPTPKQQQQKKKKRQLGSSDLSLDSALINNLLQILENLHKNENRKTDVENLQQRNVKSVQTEPPVSKAEIKAAGEMTQRENKRQKNSGEKLTGVSIKIHGNEYKQQKTEDVHSEGKPTAEFDLLDSLVSREAEGGDLKRKNSTYFDAVEKRPEENMGGDSNRMYQPTAEEGLNLNLEFGVKPDEKLKTHPRFTPSDEHLLSREFLGKETEEIIIKKISTALQEGKLSYSMALLECFLKKVPDPECARLTKLLTRVEGKSNSIMTKMEKAAWLKALSLLEEVSHVYDYEEIQQETLLEGLIEPNSSATVLDRIKQSLQLLKRKFVPIQNPVSEIEPMDTESGLILHSTISVPEIRDTRRVDDSQAILRQQCVCMLQVIADNVEAAGPREVQHMKRKLAEKLSLLEKALEIRDPGDASGSVANCCRRVASLVRLARTCRSSGTWAADAPSGVELDRTQGCVDLVKCLIKAWDTRLVMGRLSGECFS